MHTLYPLLTSLTVNENISSHFHIIRCLHFHVVTHHVFHNNIFYHMIHMQYKKIQLNNMTPYGVIKHDQHWLRRWFVVDWMKRSNVNTIRMKNKVNFHSRKLVWKSRLQNGCHFIAIPMFFSGTLISTLAPVINSVPLHHFSLCSWSDSSGLWFVPPIKQMWAGSRLKRNGNGVWQLCTKLLLILFIAWLWATCLFVGKNKTNVKQGGRFKRVYKLLNLRAPKS